MEIEGWALIVIVYFVVGLLWALADYGFTVATAGQFVGEVDSLAGMFGFLKTLFLWPVRLFGG